MASKESKVRVTNLGTEYEVYMMPPVASRAPKTKNLPNGEYVDLTTGEIRQRQRHARTDDLQSIYRTITRIRHLIDLNFTGEANEALLLLTYDPHENRVLRPLDKVKNMPELMSQNEVKQAVMADISRFMRQLKGRYQDQNHPLKYLWVIQPHDNGQLHFHVLIKQLNSKQFKPSETALTTLWGHGKATIQPIDDIDRLGAYLSAGMLNTKPDPNDPDKSTHHERLKLYPSNMKLYSTSRNFIRPKTVTMTVEELKATGINLDTPEFVSERQFTDQQGNVHPKHHVFYTNPERT